jgi:hypothetical protein
MEAEVAEEVSVGGRWPAAVDQTLNQEIGK